MWLEAIITTRECAELVRSITPMSIDLGAPGRTLTVAPPDDVELVPGKGLRLAGAGRVTWTLGAVRFPVAVRVGSLLLTPTIESREGREVLALRARVEQLDVKALPDFVDGTVLHRINDALAARDEALVWRFAQALERRWTMPRRIESMESIELRVRWGKLRITRSALVLAVSLEVHATPRVSAHAAE